MPDAALGDAIEVLDWHPDGHLLAAADLAGDVVVIDVDVETIDRPVPACGAAVSAMAWSPTGTSLAVATTAGRVVIAGPRGPLTIELDRPASTLAWSPTGDLLAIGTGWDVATVTGDGDHLGEVGPFEGGVHAVAWMPGPGPLVAATGTGIAWCLVGISSEPIELWPTRGLVRGLEPDARRERLACGDLGGVLRIFDLQSGDDVAVSGFSHRVAEIAWAPSGRHLAVADRDDVVVWELEGVVLAPGDPTIVTWSDGDVIDLAFEPSAMPGRLATIDTADQLHIGTIDQPSCPRTIELAAPPRCLRWQPGRPAVAVGDRSGHIEVVPAPR